MMPRALREFFARETAGGIVMLLAALAAMALANSPASGQYLQFIHAPLPGGLDTHAFVSEVLMPVFFLFVGLELKHEMRAGALATPSQRLLPLIAAAGGVVVPALLYLAITRSEPLLASGWAIPTATDIAFAIAVVSLAGSRVPAGAKIFLLAIAIYDDLAAILIIALFYTGELAILPLAGAGAVLLAMAALNRYTRAPTAPILLLGLALGLLLHAGGIHTTVAGMLTGMCVAQSAVKPLVHRLHPWVVFGILPLFAFASAGVNMAGMTLDTLLTPLPLGIALGLFLGKQLGIFGATMAAVKLGIARLPEQTDARTLYAIAIIAGIGFTMSLFIGQLAFADAALQDALKLGVMAGSLFSAVAGFLLLRR